MASSIMQIFDESIKRDIIQHHIHNGNHLAYFFLNYIFNGNIAWLVVRDDRLGMLGMTACQRQFQEHYVSGCDTYTLRRDSSIHRLSSSQTDLRLSSLYYRAKSH